MRRSAALLSTVGLRATLAPSAQAAATASPQALSAVLGGMARPVAPAARLRWPAANPYQASFHAFASAAEPAPKEPAPAFGAGYVAPHKGLQGSRDTYLLMNPVYTPEYVVTVKPQHLRPDALHQKVGYYAIQAIRMAFDKVTGYGHDMTEAKWLQRMLFLETVAGVPGMVAGMLRHLASLRSMQRDHGWIHTLLEEAENERMHLLTFLKLREPGPGFRAMVLLAQGVFFNFYFVAYLLSPKTCHSMVGYLEEEAVKTYTHALEEIDAGRLWKGAAAPDIALVYWKLPAGASMRDLILAIRADEACHSHVNHTFAGMKKDEMNPFAPGSHQVP